MNKVLDPITNFEDTVKTEEELKTKIKFPVNMTIRIICSDANTSHTEELTTFLATNFNLTAQISRGNASKKGTYVTYLAKTTMPSLDVMKNVYQELMKLSFVMHVL